jgi:hypothetical protein
LPWPMNAAGISESDTWTTFPRASQMNADT